MLRYANPFHGLSAAILATTLTTTLVAGCAAKSKPEPEGPEAASDSEAEASTESKLLRCKGSLKPASDGLLGNFEDGGAQLPTEGGRDGSWWLSKDDKGSTFTTPAGEFAPEDSGTGSGKAIHVVGTTAAGGYSAWGVEVGLTFRADGGLYDASKYAGFSFKAKKSGPTEKVRVNFPDVNTHPEAGVCEECGNHFRRDFILSEEWQTYMLRFREITQRDGWGKPRPENLTTDKMIRLSFSLEGAREFDVWFDDIKFLDCADE